VIPASGHRKRAGRFPRAAQPSTRNRATERDTNDTLRSNPSNRWMADSSQPFRCGGRQRFIGFNRPHFFQRAGLDGWFFPDCPRRQLERRRGPGPCQPEGALRPAHRGRPGRRHR
jgi:hypothetical protein